MRTSHTRNIIMNNFCCAIAMFFWASSFPANEVLLETWGTVSLTFLKFGLGGPILLLLWISADGLGTVYKSPWKRGILIGGIGFGLGGIIFIVGQSLSDAIIPAIAAAMMPIAGAFLEVIFDKRRLSLQVFVSIALALAGGILASGENVLDGEYGFGAILCVIAVVLFAWGTRATTRDLPDLSIIGQTTITIVGALLFVATCFMILYCFDVSGIEVGLFTKKNLYLIFVVVIISFVIAQTMWIWGARGLGILLASFHMNAVPFYVMLIIVVLMDGDWNWNRALGAILVAIGVTLAQRDLSYQSTSNI